MGNLQCPSPGDIVKFKFFCSSILLMFPIDEFTILSNKSIKRKTHVDIRNRYLSQFLVR